MPRAEVGSTKHVANQMKSKGLQRLRWWCEICAKQCRDANGFKCHTQSESHIRNIQLVGENPKKYIQGFSTDFQRDFVALLRTAHGEKSISANRFYNEYIRDKEHVHMNATKWSSLTEFVKHLGREGIVNVIEDEKDGLCIAWRDTSSAAVQRREEIREMEMAEARSGAGEDKMLKKMAKRAQEQADEKARVLEARKAAQNDSASPPTEEKSGSAEKRSESGEENKAEGGEVKEADDAAEKKEEAPVKISFGLKGKAPPAKPVLGKKNVFKRAADGSEEKPKKKVKL